MRKDNTIWHTVANHPAVQKAAQAAVAALIVGLATVLADLGLLEGQLVVQPAAVVAARALSSW